MSSRPPVVLLLARIVNWVVALSERREWIHAPTGIHLPRLAESLSSVNVPRRLSASGAHKNYDAAAARHKYKAGCARERASKRSAASNQQFDYR